MLTRMVIETKNMKSLYQMLNISGKALYGIITTNQFIHYFTSDDKRAKLVEP